MLAEKVRMECLSGGECAEMGCLHGRESADVSKQIIPVRVSKNCLSPTLSLIQCHILSDVESCHALSCLLPLIE
jgi:hypothetical protein